MTAEPVHRETVPGWLIPPAEGFTVDDLFRLTNLPPHTELIDGSLIFVSPHRNFHALVVEVLLFGLRRTAPEHLRVRREMTVILDKRQGPEPDLSVVRAEADTDLDQTAFKVADVLLAVEVVSPESERRDRERKPQLYAQAGIRYFWLVENVAGKAVVHTYDLDPLAKTYTLTGVHHERLKLSVPFTIDVDLTEINRI